MHHSRELIDHVFFQVNAVGAGVVGKILNQVGQHPRPLEHIDQHFDGGVGFACVPIDGHVARPFGRQPLGRSQRGGVELEQVDDSLVGAVEDNQRTADGVVFPVRHVECSAQAFEFIEAHGRYHAHRHRCRPG